MGKADILAEVKKAEKAAEKRIKKAESKQKEKLKGLERDITVHEEDKDICNDVIKDVRV